jgi:transcriptional regulator with XRE-family HTH domain
MVSLLETGQRGRRPGRELVLKIAKAFNEPEDFWLDLTRFARDHEVIDYRPHFRDVVEADPYLTAEQKQALITTYVGFRASSRRERPRVITADELPAHLRPRRRRGSQPPDQDC